MVGCGWCGVVVWWAVWWSTQCTYEQSDIGCRQTTTVQSVTVCSHSPRSVAWLQHLVRPPIRERITQRPRSGSSGRQSATGEIPHMAYYSHILQASVQYDCNTIDR